MKLTFLDKSIRLHDNIAISNMRMKCCSVPSPARECTPKEDLVVVAECDNVGGLELSRCSVPLYVGFTHAYEAEFEKIIQIYESVGWTLGCVKPDLEANLKQLGNTQNFNWSSAANVEQSYFHQMNRKVKIFQAEGKTKVQIKQVIGRCGVYKLYTDTFIKVDLGVGGDVIKEERMTFTDIASKQEHICWESNSPIRGRDWVVTENTREAECTPRDSWPPATKSEALDMLTDTIEDKTKSGFVLSTPNPELPFHKWGDWELCPSGTYLRGWTSVASGKGVQGDNDRDDYSGVVFIKGQCQSPDNNPEKAGTIQILQDDNEWEEKKWVNIFC